MSPLAARGPNAEQIRYWNEVSGPRWVASQALLDAQISPLGLAALERADVAPGERVLDVGCGCGQTTLQLGARVGPGGSVTGIDLSRPMLERARERAARAGAANLRFEQGDAQERAFPPGEFDLLFSRFGVMFFSDPKAAFGNLAAGLAPSGRLVFVCWQALERNAWLRVPLRAAGQHVELPAPPAPGTPGPFALSNSGRVRSILEAAQLEDIAFDSLEGELTLAGGGSLPRTTEFVLNLGPTGALLREAAPAVRARAADSVRDALAPYWVDRLDRVDGADGAEGGVRMGYAAWIVSARKGRAPTGGPA